MSFDINTESVLYDIFVIAVATVFWLLIFWAWRKSDPNA